MKKAGPKTLLKAKKLWERPFSLVYIRPELVQKAFLRAFPLCNLTNFFKLTRRWYGNLAESAIGVSHFGQCSLISFLLQFKLFLERNTRLFLCYNENQTNLQSKLGHSPTFPHCLWKCLNYSSLISLFSQTLFECSRIFWSNLESNKEIQLSILITRYLTSCKLTKKCFL